MTWKIIQGDVRDKLAELPEKSVQCVVTSPPYWGLRSYLPVDTAIEEASELIKAICKLKRSGNSLETVSAVAEEIADKECDITCK